MKFLSKPIIFAVILGVLPWIGPSKNISGQPPEIELAKPYDISRIYADKSGNSHFGGTEITFQLADFAPPAPPISVSSDTETKRITFISSPVGWCGSWHTSPRRQIIICLAGELEVQVSDGEIRTFEPGSVILVEDILGKGHISRVVGSERVFMAAISIVRLRE